MKKILILMMLVFSIGCFAENSGENVYCEIVGTETTLFSKKLTILVDFGQKTSYWNEYKNKMLLDENGDAIKFNSMVDALNFMSNLGWSFQQAYVVTTSNQNVYHWLMKKTLAEGESINDGLNTKK